VIVQCLERPQLALTTIENSRSSTKISPVSATTRFFRFLRHSRFSFGTYFPEPINARRNCEAPAALRTPRESKTVRQVLSMANHAGADRARMYFRIRISGPRFGPSGGRVHLFLQNGNHAETEKGNVRKTIRTEAAFTY